MVRLAIAIGIALTFWRATGAQDSLGGNRPTPMSPVAVSGEPFGVLIAEVPLPPNLDDGLPRILVSDSEGRIFYPVVSVRQIEVADEPPAPRGRVRPGGLIDRVRSRIRDGKEKRQVPVAIRVAALFRGEGPLSLTLTGDINQRITFAAGPSNPTQHRSLALRWWESYVTSARDATSDGEVPKLVQRYLLSMLSRRMGLPQADLDPPDPDSEPASQTLETLALLAAIDPLREQILEDVLSFPSASTEMTHPVPAEPAWQSHPLPPIGQDTVIESIAGRVPPECFYLRFGSFGNYVWLQEIGERYGGDIAQAVLLRGFNHEASARMERMLAAKMTTLAKMFGDKLISDMAVIGSDLYMKEGASIGVIFQATNVRLLSGAMESDRKSVAAQTPGASLQTISIAGQPVSLLSTPDNRVRSFLVSHGNYIFVTTSQTLATRFLEVGNGDRALADVPAFRAARGWMPENNNYSIFAYLSPEFFHRLVSPQYQIELRRRLEAIAHLEIVEIATQAAKAEGRATDLPSLMAAELLPAWFDQRIDGAQALRIDDAWVDSLRGARGSFLPIADIRLQGVSQSESTAYARISDFYRNQWGAMDPMMIGLRRFQAAQPGRETVAIEAYLAPFNGGKYGWVGKLLAEPTPLEIQLPADDIATAQLHIRGDTPLLQAAEDYHLFAGVKDMIPPSKADTQGLIKTFIALKSVPAYLGAWPKPGLIELLPFGIGLVAPDALGYSRMLGGLWRWQDASFSLLSFDRQIIDQVIAQLAAVQSQDVAQARVRVADLSGSKMATWINSEWYRRGWMASEANTRLLDSVHQQLGVPQEECLETAQKLLDVKLQCPLGGAYEYAEIPAGPGGWWQSTAWQQSVLAADGELGPPPDYIAPWIEWFRGGEIHVTQQTNSLAVVGSVELEMPPLPAELNLPVSTALPSMNFDLFQLPMKLFGGESAKTKASSRSF